MADWMDDIEKYRRGELSPKEMHELEKRALSDPFLADALDGVNSINVDELATDLDQLNRSIHRKKDVVYFTPLRIAAGVVILIGASLFLFWPSNKPEQLAKVNEETPAPESGSTAGDTVRETEAKPQEQLTLAEESKKEEKRDQSQKEQTQKIKPGETGRTTKKITAAEATPQPAVALNTDSTVAGENLARDTQAARSATGDAAKAAAQTSHISGTVTVAEDGLPLPGVTIKVKDSPLGTTTDINGHYTLNVPDSASLIFSFVGMQTSEISTSSKSTIDVKMNEDVSQLSEVVITRSALARPLTEEPLVILAEPVGGIKAYDKYMEDNLRYPQQALDNDVKGRVVVEFNVGIDGSLNNFVVMRSLGFGCDDEVIRLVKNGPTWRPTTEDNKPVESSVRVRMKFDPAKAKRKR
jgi:TonB family protein